MTSLEAIGSSHPAISSRGEAKPAVREPEPKNVQPAEKAEKAEIPEKRQSAEAQPRGAHARLNYDEETKEVFVEILDPQTGEVLQRFPAEELPDQIRAAGGEVGSLVETFA